MTPRTDLWLDAEEMDAWRAFAETVFDLMGALEHDLSPHGLTLGDYQVLVYLSEAEDRSMRMCDLAKRLQLSPSGLTRRLDGLVRTGVVERRAGARDRRVMYARLTPAGMALLDDAAPTHVRSVRTRVLDHLDRDEVAAMARSWSAIRRGLRADEACSIVER